jgi:hypothetical protein
MTTCPNCDTPGRLTTQGLCPVCQDQLRFITRPAAHREMWRRQVAAQAETYRQWEQQGVIVVSSVPHANDLWLCDACNDPIAVNADHTLIPLLGGYALCGRCVTRFPYWPDAWTHPTPRACSCHACQLPLRRLQLQDRITRQVDPPGDRGLER